MDRVIVYPGAIPLDTDLLSTNRNTMKALGYLAQGMFGTTTQVVGLAANPTAPASLSITIGPGAITLATVVDANAYGSLAADTTDPLVKMGINIFSTTLTFVAPTTSGQSQNFLVQAAFSEQGANPVALPFFDAANPSVPFSGPSNSGAAQNTLITQTVNISVVAGAAASTGSQTTPSPSANNFPLYVVTLANGQTSITSSNITVASGSPFVGGGSLQPGRLLNVQTFSSVGTFSYVPTAGANTIEVEVCGGGGGGGGVSTTTSSTVGAAGGGAGGGYARSRLTNAQSLAGTTITVGSGGAGASGAAGGNGTTSSFGALLSGTGGNGAILANNTSNTVNETFGGVVSVGGGSGGNLLNLNGGYGRFAVINASLVLSGEGGASFFGPGAPAVNSSSAGTNAVNPGTGGSGGSLPVSSGPAKGGNGAPGIVIIREYS